MVRKNIEVRVKRYQVPHTRERVWTFWARDLHSCRVLAHGTAVTERDAYATAWKGARKALSARIFDRCA